MARIYHYVIFFEPSSAYDGHDGSIIEQASYEDRMNTSARPKATLSDDLRLNCLITAQKLKLIPEFSRWLELSLEIQLLFTRNRLVTPYDVLWRCFCFGKPLCVLLDLMSTPSFGQTKSATTHHPANDTTEEREKWVKNFIDRVQLLEAQGCLSYGEVFRTEDLFNGTFPGFAKVCALDHHDQTTHDL